MRADRATRLINFDVADMSDAELDRHMDIDHDRDSGERGLHGRRVTAVATHRQLHRTGVWSEIPHFHNGTLPFGEK